jgi:hypothetical protein
MKVDRIKRLQSIGEEVNETIGKQFVSDKNLSECIREIQVQFDKWDLRPLERDIVIRMLQKYEKDRKLAEKMKEVEGKAAGLAGRILGGK